MSQPGQESGRLQYPAWDGVVAAALGMALLAAGWADTRAYLIHRGEVQPDFGFVRAAGERIGEDEWYRHGESFVLLDHMGGLEMAAKRAFRHAYGPSSTLLISTKQSRARMTLTYHNPVEGQDIAVVCDGRVIEQFNDQPVGTIGRVYTLDLRPGINTVAFTFSRYNGAGVDSGSRETRPLAGTFFKLELTLE